MIQHGNTRSRNSFLALFLSPTTLCWEGEKPSTNIALFVCFCRRRELNPGHLCSKRERYPLLHCLSANPFIILASRLYYKVTLLHPLSQTEGIKKQQKRSGLVKIETGFNFEISSTFRSTHRPRLRQTWPRASLIFWCTQTSQFIWLDVNFVKKTVGFFRL